MKPKKYIHPTKIIRTFIQQIVTEKKRDKERESNRKREIKMPENNSGKLSLYP